MNYTKPNEPGYTDKPQDWLNSALIFATALGHLFKETEGVVVDLTGDMKLEGYEDLKKVIVFSKEGRIHISPLEGIDVAAGTLVWVEKPLEDEE